MKTGFNVFNIGTGVPTSILTLAKILSHLIGKEDLTPIYTRPREGDIRNSWCDTVNAKKGLNFSTSLPLEEGLRRTLDVYTVDKSPIS